MRIFLTGGAGYIGSAVAHTLLEAGHAVTIFDSLQKGHRGALPKGAEFVHADLADKTALKAALSHKGFDAVMHFAAFIEAGESMQDPGLYFENNLSNSIHLIEATCRAGIRRFVLSSTAAVYRSSDKALHEESPLGPTNTYGATKLMIEQCLDWFGQIYSLRYAALRYFNAAGALPGRGEAHRPETHLIPLVLQVPLGQRKKIQIFGTDYPTPDGTAIRDYVHIADLASAHMLALEALTDKPKLVYNLGNGVGYSVREVIETARSLTGHDIPVEETSRRAGDSARLVASSARIREALGWQPQRPDLKDIIASAWQWHQSHPEGYGL